MSLLLTVAERERFATWLELEATSGEAIVDQLEKMGQAGAVIAKRERTEIAAARIIAMKLRSIEDA